MKSEVVLIYGPMKSGKTATLIDLYKKFTKNNIVVDCFKSPIDTRNIGVIKSRAYDYTIPCTTLINIDGCLKSVADIIMIDEFQFIQATSIIKIINNVKKHKRSLYLFGLDKIASGDEWPTYTIVKDLVDRKIKLTATCDMCGDIAEYTKIESQSEDTIQIDDGSIKYYPVCKKCFYKKY